MPCERAGIAERLLSVRNRPDFTNRISYLAAAFAHVGLFPSVNSVVNSQG